MATRSSLGTGASGHSGASGQSSSSGQSGPSGQSEPHGRTWAKTARTRQSILDAARDAFLEHGYADVSIADIVASSGVSVGSIYHHFGGKSELFIALYLTHRKEYEDAVRVAVSTQRAAGVTVGSELFLAGARAYLETAWERRAFAQLLLDDVGPPALRTMRTLRSQAWVRSNGGLLEEWDTPVGRLRASVITSMIGTAAREVSACYDRRDAEAMIDEAGDLLRILLR
ncbi:MAG: transcriptional regulator, TetR family [Pseudonocardiales bacterium]|nr:transcriptional regulator, TetR family [Pseudonocardiales bacterium]